MSNPLLRPSTLPYGLPPFPDIRDEHYLPAFDAAFAEQRAEVDAIVALDEPATFENTIVALEKSGQNLRRVEAAFYNVSSSNSNPVLDDIEAQIAPLYAAHRDAIQLNAELFARIRTVYAARHDLDPEARYLVERYHVEGVLAGAGLDMDARLQLAAYNAQLAELNTRFDQNLQADTVELAVVFDNADELDGLDAGQLSATAEAAHERGLDGKYVVTLILFTGHPFLTQLTNRASRERIMAASRARGIHGGEHDNQQTVLEIARIRAKRAELLGFANHSAWVAADSTAKDPEAIARMLGTLAPAAVRNARNEADALRDIAVADGITQIEAWDWGFYTEKARQAKYSVDTAAMKPYFELDRVLEDGVFFAATRLYGITFSERPDLVSYHPDARIWEVFDEDRSALGLFIGDYYARDSKRGGAWMNSLVDQNTLLGMDHAVVVNNMNIPRPAAGEPTLLTFDEVETAFHEFGHALHGLFAHVRYPSLAGTNVARDFVEFPSQVNEMLMLWPEVLANYAKHYQSGEPLPPEWIEALEASTGFNQGFETTEYLAASLLDQTWHRLSAKGAEGVSDVGSFAAAALAAAGVDVPFIPPRYASTYFQHTFSGGYDAGYYSYIWSEVLDADTVEWFIDNGGLTRANGERFRQRLLGVGGSHDPLDAYRSFRGRDAVIEPLLRRRGLE